MSKFDEMSAEEQKQLCIDVADCLKANDLSDVNVSVYREDVCQMKGEVVNERIMMKVEKQLPTDKEAQAIKFSQEVRKITNGITGVTIDVKCQIGAGDKYKTITGVKTLEEDSQAVSIEHKQGEVLMIDFWATWCPPCQKPMQHNEDMLTNNAEKWGDKVKIIGLSIDKDAETVKSHVTNKGWLKPIHYWRSTSDCSEVYSVKGVPHVMIIDTNGKIAFKGHPANRPDLVADFDNLLAGKTLTGEGCGASPAPAGGEAPEGFKVSTDDELAEIHSQMTKFKETGKQMQEALSQNKDLKLDEMQRDFCVLTLEANMSPATQTWQTKFENHRVLVGTQEQVDACKAQIVEKLTGCDAVLKEQYHIV